MRDDGYNPIRWKCNTNGKGCFLKEAQPPSEWMCTAFDGRISFSDMDRIVERHGRALVWDQKKVVSELESLNNTSSNGQAIMWRNLTRGKIITALAVAGLANPFEVEAYRWCWNGKWQEIVEATTTDLFDLCKRWFTWANSNPVTTIMVNGAEDNTEGFALGPGPLIDLMEESAKVSAKVIPFCVRCSGTGKLKGAIGEKLPSGEWIAVPYEEPCSTCNRFRFVDKGGYTTMEATS